MNLCKPLPILICKLREISLKLKKFINLVFGMYSIVQHLKSRIKHLANIRQIFIRHDHDQNRISQKISNIRIRNSSKNNPLSCHGSPALDIRGL
jgi:hypothetical protein